MIEILQTLMLSAIPALIAGISSYYGSKKKAESEINTLQIQNKNDLEKLMEQHKIDLESLAAKHKMDIERSDCEHKHQIEIIQINHQNELQRKSKELEDAAKYQTTSNLMNEMTPALMGMFLGNPDVKKELESRIIQSLSQNMKKQASDLDIHDEQKENGSAEHVS